MALDGIYLYSLVEDLKKSILNAKIDKINQPEKDEIIITLRKDRKNLKFLVSASSNHPRIHLTETTKPNPLQAPMFTMVLRKYLIGGKIVNIEQVLGDRVVKFTIEASDELGFNSLYFLIVEIMGRHSNITLVRERDNKIMESIKHIGADINSYRVLYPGITYKYPPASKKLNPYHYTSEELDNYVLQNNINFSEKFFSEAFTGISKMVSTALYNNYLNIKSEFDSKSIYDYISIFISNLTSAPEYIIYQNKNGDYIDFYAVDLDGLHPDSNKIPFENPSLMMDIYFSEKDKQDRIKNRSTNIQKLLMTNIDRCINKSKKLNTLLKKCDEKEIFRVKGDLLTAFIYSINRGQSEISLLNFYNENEEYLTISLDPNKSPSENIQIYYKKYNKLKKSEESALEQLEKNEEELQYLNSVLTNIQNCENYTEIDDIKEELISTGYIRKRRLDKVNKKQKSSKPLHFISSEGIDIYVGKNNIQNDYLSLKFANKNHMWLHTKNIPGSHVIVCSDNVPDKTLTEAACLASYYSKAQNSSKVPVDYTLVKNLKKPNGSKPGMVIYHTNYTMLAEPTTFPLLNLKRV